MSDPEQPDTAAPPRYEQDVDAPSAAGQAEPGGATPHGAVWRPPAGLTESTTSTRDDGHDGWTGVTGRGRRAPLPTTRWRADSRPLRALADQGPATESDVRGAPGQALPGDRPTHVRRLHIHASAYQAHDYPE